MQESSNTWLSVHSQQPISFTCQHLVYGNGKDGILLKLFNAFQSLLDHKHHEDKGWYFKFACTPSSSKGNLWTLNKLMLYEEKKNSAHLHCREDESEFII